MAGDPTRSEGAPAPEPGPPVPPAVDGEVPVEKIDCPACGASLTPRSLGVATTFACEYCGSIFDRTHERVAIVERFEGALSEKPVIPLGRRGTLGGVEWEAVGFVVRRGSAEGETWKWREYLLFNPYRGFRFLVSFEAGWSLVQKVAGVPRRELAGRLAWKGKVYTAAEKYAATVELVLGEFTWRVRRGETAFVTDYKSGPRVLCEERTDEEVTYSLGQPVPAGEVGKAFGVKPGAGAVLAGAAPGGLTGNQLLIIVLIVFCLIASCIASGGGRGGGGGGGYSGGSSGFRGGK